ncbi:MAG: thioesterase family protein [Clostridiales Family XIII bacterium]|jgi:predicted thioesterase|nr:thioesterase family protein [Clostridiales Family XIII bacterium]
MEYLIENHNIYIKTTVRIQDNENNKNPDTIYYMENLLNKTSIAKTLVDKTNTAAAVKSGELPVFSTPSMIALMEEASVELIKNSLKTNESTVGIYLDIKHIKASPINANIKANAKLIKINEKELTFKLSAEDDKGIIGHGIHKRFIIDKEKFIAKL